MEFYTLGKGLGKFVVQANRPWFCWCCDCAFAKLQRSKVPCSN